MLISFVIIPWLCALITACAAVPFGALLSWRRMIYFGEALAHCSLLGIAAAIYFSIPIYLGIWSITLLLILLFYLFKKYTASDGNNILGVISHISLAGGFIFISKLESVRTDLLSYLFGDILSTTGHDLLFIIIASIIALSILKIIWQPIMLMTINESIAHSELKNTVRYEIIFLLLLGTFCGVMVHYFGVFLVIALLVIPINSAVNVAHTPEQSIVIAIIFSAIATTCGVALAWLLDFPVAAAIVSITGVIYVISTIANLARKLYHRSKINIGSKKV